MDCCINNTTNTTRTTRTTNTTAVVRVVSCVAATGDVRTLALIERGRIIRHVDEYILLALKILEQAVADTRRGDLEATSWLAEVGLSWLEAAGFDIRPETWADWIRQGCPKGIM